MENGFKGVWVPAIRNKRCEWTDTLTTPRGVIRKRKGTWMPWDVLMSVLEFSLDNAYVHMPDGRILRQTQGIPMGDPLSPGMTIGTCAWMENEWLHGITLESKRYFRAARYMDDILCAKVEDEGWKEAEFTTALEKSECYWQPLKLEKAGQTRFLETEFESDGDSVCYRLKNDNATGPNIWRYHHYKSALPYETKRATILASLRKIHIMTSDGSQRFRSAMEKLREFKNLQYPIGILRFFCAIMARDTSDLTWRQVRDAISST